MTGSNNLTSMSDDIVARTAENQTPLPAHTPSRLPTNPTPLPSDFKARQSANVTPLPFDVTPRGLAKLPSSPPAAPTRTKTNSGNGDYFPIDMPGIPASPDSEARRIPTSRISRRHYLSKAKLNHREFYHPISSSFSMILAELTTIMAAMLIVWSSLSQLPDAWGLGLSPLESIAVWTTVAMLPVANFMAGVIPGYGVGPVKRLRLRCWVVFTLLIVSGLVNMTMAHPLAMFDHLIAALIIGFPLMLIMDGVIRRVLMRYNLWGAPVIIIGHGDVVPRLVRTLKDEPSMGWRPVAILDDFRAGTGTVAISGVPVVGGRELASDFTHLVRTALVAFPADQTHNLVALSERLPFPQVILIPDLFGMQSLWVSTCDVGGALGLQVRKELLISRNRAIKLLLDYLVALPMAIGALPVVLACAVWIRLVDRGSPFYSQEREGYRGSRIRVWKLRTMFTDNKGILEQHLTANPEARSEWSRFFKLRNDPRILPGVGAFLRRSSLDELPQLWNVLRGDISMVGPRPFPLYHLESFSQGFRALRASVRPGLTGMWQVSSRSEGDLLVQEQQDTYYIRNWSPWLDLHIIIRTISVVLRGSGAR